MKVMISYFNNIRNFTPNMIPFSTAMWDPKWYRQNGDTYIDKRGVINGFKASELVFNFSNWLKLENKDKDCVSCIAKEGNKVDRTNVENFCPFMRCYLAQLRRDVNFKAFFSKLNAICHFVVDAIPVLIVHEKPDRLCCERYVLKQWFKENGVELEEVAHK